MTAQSALFDAAIDPNEAPICSSCRIHPARWDKKRDTWYRYCGTTVCRNPTKRCITCQTEYLRGTPGSALRYCSEECEAPPRLAIKSVTREPLPVPAIKAPAPEPIPTDGPICPSCRLRPARWNRINQEWRKYCGGSNCGSPTKLCNWCQQEYRAGTIGSGTKYCSDECKNVGYNAGQIRSFKRELIPCAHCGHQYRPRVDARADICPSCRKGDVSRINQYRLNTEWALRLINSTNCDCCGERFRTDSQSKANAVIDHDHACCPGKGGCCGECVRGIVCHRCNNVAGAIEADPILYHAVQEYLDRTGSR